MHRVRFTLTLAKYIYMYIDHISDWYFYNTLTHKDRIHILQFHFLSLVECVYVCVCVRLGFGSLFIIP